jgi:hypothetical protein
MKWGAAARAERVWFGRAEAPTRTLADLAAMLWKERAHALAVAGAICALGLVAAVTTPQPHGESRRLPLTIVTLLTAGVVSTAAGLSRGLTQRNVPTPQARIGGKPAFIVVGGGASPDRLTPAAPHSSSPGRA